MLEKLGTLLSTMMPSCASEAYLLEESALRLFLLSLPAMAVIQTIPLKKTEKEFFITTYSRYVTNYFSEIENNLNDMLSLRFV